VPAPVTTRGARFRMVLLIPPLTTDALKPGAVMARVIIPSPYYLAICDEDKKKFNVMGPMSDDSEWTQRVSAAQRQGRRVRIQGPPMVPMTRVEFIDHIRRFTRYTYTDEPILLL
jgi:hypothetical protein